MFSVGYFNKSMVINAINISRISFQNIEKLRCLVIQLLQNPCKKIILDFNGVKFIDSQSFEVIDRLHFLANSHNVDLYFTNIHDEVLELFALIPATKNYRVVNEVIQPALSIKEEVII